jgi:hydrogenase maturation protein HypF
MVGAARKSENGHAPQRLRVAVRGAVQGVGFRPFVYRLAKVLALQGWVNNSSQGVFIEVEGPPDALKSFLLRLPKEIPPRASIQSLESSYLDPAGYHDFDIRQSDDSGEKTAVVLPDIATCRDCLAEIFDPRNRRYRYPFTNCTNCGPRFSIIESLPYDRPNTTMKAFEMCRDCTAEYEDPYNRRFHAQPNACSTCGPHIELWNAGGLVIASHGEAFLTAIDAIRAGKIIAVKGLGGFHLMVDTRSEFGIRELRKRKHREEKPFAVMFPSLETVQAVCFVSDLESRLLTSPESPVVLLRKRTRGLLPDSLAPDNPYLGVMLPYTPLHHLLMSELGFPVVATSGNLSDEPICTDENEAVERLKNIADLFLVHNRPIARHIDDSIVRVVMGREMVLRRARGFAPLPVLSEIDTTQTLAVGAHLKNSVAIAAGKQIFVSQHIGDLETEPAFDAFGKVIDSLEDLYDLRPERVAFDAHPDYLSTRWAKRSGLEPIPVQHHYAHILSCMAENEIAPPVLGIAWDGTGYGLDGTIWGGEFLQITETGFERVAHLRQFRLPGGDKAVKEPRRSAIGLLYEIFGDVIFENTGMASVAAFATSELELIKAMLGKKINSPVTSSAGRLFDAVASITGLRQQTRFEGQAAMSLEFNADLNEESHYKFDLISEPAKPAIIDWEPMVRGIISDLAMKISRPAISAKFHNTLVEMMLSVAQLSGETGTALSGGCFQNRYLAERAISRLQSAGLRVYWHQRVPPNDGGIALGQAVAAASTVRNMGKQDLNNKAERICV